MVYPASEYDIESYLKTRGVVPRPSGNQGVRKYEPDYLDCVSAFDIETTVLPDIEQAVMYIWQWAFDDICVYGRTWDEFRTFRARVLTALDDKFLVVWVHNLSYEFQFLSDPSIYDFCAAEVFAVRPRKILKATMRDFHIEFRCSYIHSNMSLAKFLERHNVVHEKLELDYEKTRYPWTPLTPDELAYCVNDVLGLTEALRHEMEIDGDNLHTIPITSTGYVRREAKRAIRLARRQVHGMLPDYEVYKMLREAFRGGNTHASRHFTGDVVKDVHSYDRSSSYPDVICNDKFPMSAFWHTGYMETADAQKLVDEGRYACLFRLAMWRVELRSDEEPCPYIPLDKCRYITGEVLDNGRVLQAQYLEITVTDIDYKIIQRQYKAKSVIIRDSAYCRYGYLPKSFRDLTIDYYRRKTRLKGVAGEEYFYARSKELLNSLYGMTAQRPLHDVYEYGTDYEGLFQCLKAGEEDYNKGLHRQWLTYAWGVWVTAWARLRLDEGIELVNRTPGAWFVYADTDSVKYTGNVDWTGYNRQREKASLKSGAVAEDPSGKMHYMGVYEHDGDYTEFRTWGAKKYAYTEHGKLHITVSGVGKAAGAAELEKHGGLEAFAPGFVFREAGGLEAKYNDVIDSSNKVINIEGHDLTITRNIALLPSEYTLGIASEYEDVIKYNCIEGLYLDDIFEALGG